MTDRYARIRDALKMEPTPGPWDEIQNECSRWTDICHGSNRRYATPVAYVPPCSVLDENGIWKESKDETIANAKHVAACDPDTIRELLAERDQLAAALEAAREDAERWRALREMDGGEIYSLLGDCDGIHPEQADAAIDAAMREEGKQ